MRALAVYESPWGNTEKVARAVAEGLVASMDVDVMEAGDDPPLPQETVDLLDDAGHVTDPGVVLWWLPVGAGGRVVRHTSRWWELVEAVRDHREPRPLFHAALEATADGHRFVIEMAPQWAAPKASDRGVVVTGPVGVRSLGRSRLFRYEVRCWREGLLPDRASAVGGPVTVAWDEDTARLLIRHTRDVPPLTWGRRVPPSTDMWNSNSLVSWLLRAAGVPDVTTLSPPDGGRAPGWGAGLAVDVPR